MNKKFFIINTFLIFAIGFLVHNLYFWIPCSITSIFPVNESLYEHMKLIYLSPIIASSILYFIFKRKKYKMNNFIFGLIVSTVFNIIIFYLLYLPLYHNYGESMILSLTTYFVTIILSQYLYYLIVEVNNSKRLNVLSFIMLLVIESILLYFTYHPIKIPFFFDIVNHYYGIK